MEATRISSFTSKQLYLFLLLFTFLSVQLEVFARDSDYPVKIKGVAQITKKRMASVYDRVVCSGQNVEVDFPEPPSTSINRWTSDNSTIGLGDSGTGDIASFKALNNSLVPIVAHLNFRLYNGSSEDFTITVNPCGDVIQPADIKVDPNSNVPITQFNSLLAGTTFTWVNDNTDIGLAANGIGNLPSFKALNGGVSTAVAYITVTPTSALGCVGTPATFMVTVKPVPDVIKPDDQFVCVGATVPETIFRSNVPGTTFEWIATSAFETGCPAGGVGNIPSFIAINKSVAGVTRINNCFIDVTPILDGVKGLKVRFLIKIDAPTMGRVLDRLTFCLGDQIVLPIGSTGSGVQPAFFEWVNDTPEIGLAATGIVPVSKRQIVFNSINSGTKTKYVNITITPVGQAGCRQPSYTSEVIFYPKAVVNQIGDIDTYHGVRNQSIIFSKTGGFVGQYKWTNDNPSIGLTTSGTGNLPVYTATNNTLIPQIATIKVMTTSSIASCNSEEITFTITVNPSPTMDRPVDKVLCNSEAINETIFTSSVIGATYRWTNDNTSIGLSASGVGNLPAFTTRNLGFTAVTANITVTPIAGGTLGTPVTFTVTVNPSGDVIPLTDLSVDPNTNVPITQFKSLLAGTTFAWANDNPNIGLAANGIGDLPLFKALNSGVNPAEAHITVTPTSALGCIGTPVVFKITVGGEITMDQPADITVCRYNNVPEIIFSSPIAGATFTWTNDYPESGLPASGVGNLPSFLASDNFTKDFAQIRVVPTVNGVRGKYVLFVIRLTYGGDVSPRPNIITTHNSVVNEVKFSGASDGPIGLESFTWSNDNTNIGLAAAGSGNLPAFTAYNAGTVPLIAKITMIRFINGCDSRPKDFEITVNPTVSMDQPADFTFWAKEEASAINFTSANPGATFEWANDNAAIGLPDSGTVNIPDFQAVNAGLLPLTANITVTPTANGVKGPPVTFIITVNPTPIMDQPADKVACAAEEAPETIFNSAMVGASYKWTNDNPIIGLASNGSGNLPAFTTRNSGYVVATANITVTPMIGGTDGTPVTFKIDVNPYVRVVPVSDILVGNGTVINEIALTNSARGTVFDWENSNSAIGLAASGTGDIAAFTATVDPALGVQESTITVTTSFNGCVGEPITFKITVVPIPDVLPLPDIIACNNATVPAIKFYSSTVGTIFSWVSKRASRNDVTEIEEYTATSEGNAPYETDVMVTPKLRGIEGTPTTFHITVHPIPNAIAPVNQVHPHGTVVAETITATTVPGTTFKWENDHPEIGLSVAGDGNIPAFTATNITDKSIVATVLITPYHGGCPGNAVSYKITINPMVTIVQPVDLITYHNEAVSEMVFTGSIAGTTFSWINDNPEIGLSATGSGNLSGFTAINETQTSKVATITVTPTANGASGTAVTFTITVNPTPTMDQPADKTACPNIQVSQTIFNSPIAGVTYKWTNDNPSIGLAASGVGNLPAFTSINNSYSVATAKIVVTPEISGTDGTPVIFTITVNPLNIIDQPIDLVVCNQDIMPEIIFTSPVAGIIYRWVVVYPGGSQGGVGNMSSIVATNFGLTPIVYSVTVTPANYKGCNGTPPVKFTITINPTPDVNKPADINTIHYTALAEVPLLGRLTGTTFNWSNDNASIGLAASGSGDIPSFIAINTGLIPEVATITITPISTEGCAGVPVIFTITVNPITSMDQPADQMICNDVISTETIFNSPVAGTTYSWTNDLPSIGLAANGVGSLPTFTAKNLGTAPVTAKITVIPTANGISGAAITFSITVNPSPDVIKPADLSVCNLANVAETNFTSNVSGTTYRWTNDNPAIGLAAAGIGNLPVFTASNIGLTSINAIITIIPTANGCAGKPVTFNITVSPTPDVVKPSDIVTTHSLALPELLFTSKVIGTIFSWTNDNNSIGLADSGSGNLPAFTAVNTGAAPLVATITVTPTINGCTGAHATFTITVNPLADVVVPASFEVCGDQVIPEISFTSSVAGTTYEWTSSEPNIGLPASGTGTIPSWTPSAPLGTIYTSTVMVTPWANGVAGASKSFTIRVTTIGKMKQPTDYHTSHNLEQRTILFTSTGGGGSYTWTNDNTSIGLAASGTGALPAFIAVNHGTTPVVAKITVIHSFFGCSEPPITFTITVNPIPDMDPVADQIVCHTNPVGEINFSGSVAGTLFFWKNDNPSIGLPDRGNGDIPAFTAVNTGSLPQVANITVTYAFAGVSGAPVIFTITVNPTPDVIKPADLVTTHSLSVSELPFTSKVTGTTYSWSNNNSSIGLPDSGSGNLPAFTAVNTSTTPAIATITVVPSVNGCAGMAVTFTITVNPIPDVVIPASFEVCGDLVIPEINFSSSVPGTTFEWTSSEPNIGLPASGSGSIPSWKPNAALGSTYTSTVMVTPWANGVAGASKSFTIKVTTIGKMKQPTDYHTSHNLEQRTILFTSTGGGGSYTWTNDNTSIGLAASGTGALPAFIAVNHGTTPVVATITVIHSFFGCTESPLTFTITVNPIADVNPIANQIVCNTNLVGDIHFSGSVPGTIFSWTNDNPSIGLPAIGDGSVPSFTAVNAGIVPVVATVTVTPAYAGLDGNPVTFTITVNPTPNMNQPADVNVCNAAPITETIFDSPVAGTTYSWINNNTAIGLAASGAGNLPAFTAFNTGDNAITASIIVTPMANGCAGAAVTFTLSINPAVELRTKTLQICGPFGAVSLTDGVVDYDTNRYNYTFYRPDHTVLSADQARSVTVEGAYEVIAKDKRGGCESKLAILTVGRIALPVIKVNQPEAIYEHYSIDLTQPAITLGSDVGLTFKIYTDAACTQLLSNPENVIGLAGGQVYFIVAQSSITGCLSAPQEIKVTVLPAPKLMISSHEINEGDQVNVTISLVNGSSKMADLMVLPVAIDIDLDGSEIKIPYALPKSVTIPAGENSTTFLLTTQKSNVILKEPHYLMLSGNHQYHEVIDGQVKINDNITVDPNHPITLSISSGTIYEQGDVELYVSLPGKMITDKAIIVLLSKGLGTTMNAADYTYPTTVTIPAGAHEVSFNVTATNTTGSNQKIVIEGKATAGAITFDVNPGTVVVEAQSLLVGKVISDNGDGINDYFAIKNINEYPDNEISVINRWGQEVYHAKGYNNESVRFDSRANVGAGRGEKVVDGTYYYIISFNKNGKRAQFKGFIKIKAQ